jgi:hypothetical protein
MGDFKKKSFLVLVSRISVFFRNSAPAHGGAGRYLLLSPCTQHRVGSNVKGKKTAALELCSRRWRDMHPVRPRVCRRTDAPARVYVSEAEQRWDSRRAVTKRIAPNKSHPYRKTEPWEVHAHPRLIGRKWAIPYIGGARGWSVQIRHQLVCCSHAGHGVGVIRPHYKPDPRARVSVDGA